MENMKLSQQAIGSIMLAVQKGLMAAASGKTDEECDITSVLSSFEFAEELSGLVVLNPPILEIENE